MAVHVASVLLLLCTLLWLLLLCCVGSDNCKRSSNKMLEDEYSDEVELGRVAFEHSETPDELSDPLS